MTTRQHLVLCCIATFALITLVTPTAQAQTIWYVDDDALNDPGHGDPTVSDPDEDGSTAHPFDAIQEGIDAASNNDEVVVLDGTYTGQDNRDLDYNGKAITVRSTNPQDPMVVATTIIDCAGTEAEPHRGFAFRSGESLDSILAGLTVTNGYGPTETIGDNERSVGGAVFCTGSSPTIENCIFSGNYGYTYGGGICGYDNSDLVVKNCTFISNAASVPSILSFRV